MPCSGAVAWLMKHIDHITALFSCKMFSERLHLCRLWQAKEKVEIKKNLTNYAEW